MEAAHVRYSDARVGKKNPGPGMKPDDSWTVPLCSADHRAQHARGERLFWESAKIDPILVALALWRATGDVDAGCQIVRNAR